MRRSHPVCFLIFVSERSPFTGTLKASWSRLCHFNLGVSFRGSFGAGTVPDSIGNSRNASRASGKPWRSRLQTPDQKHPRFSKEQPSWDIVLDRKLNWNCWADSPRPENKPPGSWGTGIFGLPAASGVGTSASSRGRPQNPRKFLGVSPIPSALSGNWAGNSKIGCIKTCSLCSGFPSFSHRSWLSDINKTGAKLHICIYIYIYICVCVHLFMGLCIQLLTHPMLGCYICKCVPIQYQYICLSICRSVYLSNGLFSGPRPPRHPPPPSVEYLPRA